MCTLHGTCITREKDDKQTSPDIYMDMHTHMYTHERTYTHTRIYICDMYMCICTQHAELSFFVMGLLRQSALYGQSCLRGPPSLHPSVHALLTDQNECASVTMHAILCKCMYIYEGALMRRHLKLSCVGSTGLWNGGSGGEEAQG